MLGSHRNSRILSLEEEQKNYFFRGGYMKNWYQSMVTTLGLLGLMYDSCKEILLSAFSLQGEGLHNETVIWEFLRNSNKGIILFLCQNDNYSYRSRDALINITDKT